MNFKPPAHRHVPPGHRQSVTSTTARCSPSARQRSEVGVFPAPPFGRPRRGAAAALLSRQPREVYRLYSESEYLACTDLRDDREAPAGWPLDDGECEPSEAPRSVARRRRRARERSHRHNLAPAVAMTAACTLFGAAFLSLWRQRHDRPAAPPATARAGTARARTRSGRARAHGATRARRLPVLAEGQRGSPRRRWRHQGAARGPRPFSSPAIQTRQAAELPARPPSPAGGAAPASGGSTREPPAVAADAEFGFER